MTSASDNPFLTLATAILTAGPVWSAIQTLAPKVVTRRRRITRLDFPRGTPQRIILPQPPNYDAKLPSNWDDLKVRRRHWTTLRVVFLALAIIYGVGGLAGVVIALRTSPFALIVAVLALAYSGLMAREFLRIGPRAWDRVQPGQHAELLLDGSPNTILAEALSAATVVGGKLLSLDAKRGELVVIVDRKNKLVVSVGSTDGSPTCLRVSAEVSKETIVQSRSSEYRRLYEFIEALLVERARQEQ